MGTGAMAAILGMEAARGDRGLRRSACAASAPDSAEVVEAVNFNDPVQTVIAGSKAAVEKACEVLKANGAKRALPLPVSAPFHSSLMKPAAEKLREKLAATAFAAPQIPVINNIDVAVETDPDRIRDALCTRRPSVRCAGSSACRPSRRAASPPWSNAARARCWPAWSSVSMPS